MGSPQLPILLPHARHCRTYRNVMSPTLLVSRMSYIYYCGIHLLYLLYVAIFSNIVHLSYVSSLQYYLLMHGRLIIIRERLQHPYSSRHMTYDLLPYCDYALVLFLRLHGIQTVIRQSSRLSARSRANY